MGELLKRIKLSVYNLLVRKPNVAGYEIKGGVIVKELFTMLVDGKYNYNYRLFPLEYQKLIFKDTAASHEERETILYRAASDYISGMTDSFAVKLYKQHFGKELPTYGDCDWGEVLP